MAETILFGLGDLLESVKLKENTGILGVLKKDCVVAIMLYGGSSKLAVWLENA